MYRGLVCFPVLLIDFGNLLFVWPFSMSTPYPSFVQQSTRNKFHGINL